MTTQQKQQAGVYCYIIPMKPQDVACAITRTGIGMWKLQIDTGLVYGPYKREFTTLADLFRECRHLFPLGMLTRFKRAAMDHGQVANVGAVERGAKGNPTPMEQM